MKFLMYLGMTAFLIFVQSSVAANEYEPRFLLETPGARASGIGTVLLRPLLMMRQPHTGILQESPLRMKFRPLLCIQNSGLIGRMMTFCFTDLTFNILKI